MHAIPLRRRTELGDGTSVWLRPLRPEDRTLIRDAYENADPIDLENRFFNASFSLTEERLDYLTLLDFYERFAIICETEDGDPIGLARYGVRDDGDVEIAVVVQPEWRHRGVATVVLQDVIDAAVRNGFTTVVGECLASNRGARALMERLGFTQRAVSGGVITFSKRIES
ncbi:MAG: GNAT family N-acetyltransferase [Acidobacteria bacterium]|nr:GNAT family N-acetyltransferase [Acidobacteriota bacterium]